MEEKLFTEFSRLRSNFVNANVPFRRRSDYPRTTNDNCASR